MKKHSIHFLFLALFFLQNAAAQIIPFDSEKWTIDAKGAVIEAYEGVQNALFLQQGTATLKGVSFLNGIVEFDLYLSERRSFPGILFRMQDGQNYEELYLRAHLSGLPDAMQYTPVFNANSAWQLYHDQAAAVRDGKIGWELKGNEGYNTIFNYPYDRWLHIKLVVSGSRADVYFDQADEPTLQIRKLKRETAAGYLGIKSSFGAMHFANFSYKKMAAPPLRPLPPSTATVPKNFIKKWRISDPFDEKELDGQYHLDPAFFKNKNWRSLESEASGISNIARVTARPVRSQNTVFAAANIYSEGSQTKRLDFGYSDRARVYLNGQLLYAGNNSYRSRDYRYLGTIGFFDSLYLPLKNGKNELVIAVSETFGGWGIQAKLEDFIKISSVE
ncbi:MAG TPA: hypothetical protein ENJ95_24525 [Bacteroidetes bacterium]|nr:hypothetical protein [Bacteroidota bacterium]